LQRSPSVGSAKKKIRRPDMTLKACPFCGSEATPITIDSFWKLECNKCAMQSGIFKTKEAAITAWNTRPREVELLRWLL